MKKFDLKLAGYCGILAPIAMLLLILIAISYSPFSWTANALSDLGVNGITAILFNSSLVVCGALIFIFALGLRKILANWLGNIAIIAFISTAIALCGVGLFPENMGIIHFYFSVAFFVLLPISLFFIGLSISAKDRKLGFVILILSMCSALIWLLPKNGVAVHEFVASSAGSASCILLGIKLTRS